MLFPSNKTIASEGGVVPMPGVTILGFGTHISVASGLVKSFLKGKSVCADKEQIAKHKEADNKYFTMAKPLDILKTKWTDALMLRLLSKLYPIKEERYVDI
jgi:hypothetical protein